MKRTWMGLGLAACVAAGAAQGAGLARVDLGGAWEVSAAGSNDWIAATVPGCVHTDLLAAKRIPDPFFRDNESRVQWVSDLAWTYRRVFTVAPEFLANEHVLLRCEGLDTLAAIRVNGTDVARTDNMFRTWEFDVKKHLKAGENRIEVTFDPVLPLIRAKEKARPLPTWAYPGAAYVRKMPCNFGWDWGPTLITCGIWRPMSIVGFGPARLDDVLILQDHAKPGRVGLTVRVEAGPAADGLKARIAVTGPGGVAGPSAECALAGGKGEAALAIDKPELWWPAGMGKQPLYTVAVELRGTDEKPLDAPSRRIGLRTMKAVEKAGDEPMHFVVNGVPFFSKGGNWIPADSFLNRVNKDLYRRYVEDAVAVNMNSLRFWGGGAYEDDELFDLCDEYGLCVWMDFKFSCTTYPSFDDAFLASVRAEARDNLRRLRHHPSIAVWCGNNEIMFFRGKEAWTDKKMSEGDYYKLFRDTLGTETKALAPQADYVTGSPDCGDVHFWEVWHGGKPFDVYRNIHGFVSEFGFQAWPVPRTVESFTVPEDRADVYSPVVKYHMRSNRMYMDAKEDGTKGTDKIMNIVRMYFGEPKDFESALWLSQITQAYGIEFGARGWRAEMPKSMGCVYWQYNDTWPGASWSSVDYFGRWKALHYRARHFYAPVILSGMPDAAKGTVDLVATSDLGEPCEAVLSWRATDAAGRLVQAGKDAKVIIPVRRGERVAMLDLADALKAQGPTNLLVWVSLSVGGTQASDDLVWFAKPKDLPLADPGLAAEVAGGGGDYTVTLTAAKPALYTWLDVPGREARFSDNFIHIAPGAPVAITVRLDRPMPRDEFARALKVRSLVDTLKRP
mgnify:CR=1 FL=1